MRRVTTKPAADATAMLREAYQEAPWSDMTQAIAYARRNWTAITQRVSDQSSRPRSARQSIRLRCRGTRLQARSEKAGLDLVDQLEEYFPAH